MKKSFTMVELLVVIAVIGILAGILVPVLGNATQKARVTQARADINNLMMAIKSYESTYNALPCAYNKNRRTSNASGEKGFATDYLFWHKYEQEYKYYNREDADAYDRFVQDMSQIDITNKALHDKNGGPLMSPQYFEMDNDNLNWVSKDKSESEKEKVVNTRGLKLLEVRQDFPNRNFVDPWGHRYAIIMNDGYAKNGIIFKRLFKRDTEQSGKRSDGFQLKGKFEKLKLVGDFFVYSFGPNGIDDYGIPPEEYVEIIGSPDRDFDDINSWAVQ